jgi:hypothetical protein
MLAVILLHLLIAFLSFEQREVVTKRGACCLWNIDIAFQVIFLCYGLKLLVWCREVNIIEIFMLLVTQMMSATSYLFKPSG